MEDIRFNIKDQNALSSALYEYSGSDEYYRKGKYDKYEYQEGDTMENPILRNKKTGGPPKKDGEEGKYYKNAYSGQVYLFTGGEWKEIGEPVEIDKSQI